MKKLWSTLWWWFIDNAYYISVVASVAVLVVLTISVCKQTEFNKSQKLFNNASLEPSIDISILPIDSVLVETKDGQKERLYHYVKPDTENEDFFLAKYMIRNLGSRNLYHIKSGVVISAKKEIDYKNSDFGLVEQSESSDLAPGVSMIKFTDFPFHQRNLQHGFRFWLLFRADFENVIGLKYQYLKSFEFFVYTREREGDTLIPFWIFTTVDQQANWSKLIPSDSLN